MNSDVNVGGPDGPLLDPTSAPRYVPDAWVDELRSIRSIERPGSFDGYYDQE